VGDSRGSCWACRPSVADRFHVGPHAHVAAGIFGVLAAACLSRWPWTGGPPRALGVYLAQTWSCRRQSPHWPGRGSRRGATTSLASARLAGWSRRLCSGRSGPGWDCPGERRELVGSICEWAGRAGAPVQVVGVKESDSSLGDESTALGPDNELEATIPPDADANDAAPSRIPR